MTYTEWYEEVYRAKDPWDTHIKMTEWEARIWAILYTLNDRKGFTEWWSSIGSKNQDEIFAQLIKLMED